MRTVWAVARQTIAESIRMRIALVFFVLLAMVVLGLPFSIRGDSSLTGAVQSFMSYGLSATGVLLGMLTIFLSRSLSGEMVNRQIFLVMTKPVPRYQYILGKWLGIVVLNGVFLAFSGTTIYGMVHYIRLARPAIDDELDAAELANEVLVARHALKVDVPTRDFRERAEAEFQGNLEQGLYDNVPNFDPQRERASLLAKHETRWRVVEPLGVRQFMFSNVRCERSPDKSVQLRYKTEVSYYPPDELFRAWWSFGDPSKGTAVYDIPTRHVVGRFHIVRVPADAVAADHTLQAIFYNQNPYPNEPLYRSIIEFRPSEGPELLFLVGTFGWNLLRLLILMMCKLTFLAAVALLMTTLFSFPVACLTSFTVYVLAGARSFLADALDYAGKPAFTDSGWFLQAVVQGFTIVFNGLAFVIPDFAYYDRVEDFVNGRNIRLVWVLQGLGELAIVKTFVILGLAMLFFHRREVAEVSV